MYKVRTFSYNGFSGRIGTGLAKYEAEFVQWTVDPGVGLFSCSDGKERLIPTFAIQNFDSSKYPKQDKTGVLFGAACDG